MGIGNQDLPELEVHLDALLPHQIAAETVYRVLRAKIDRLAARVSVLEDQIQALSKIPGAKA